MYIYYYAIWNISRKYIYFFITKVHASDGQDNRLVTRKLYDVGASIKISDMHIFLPVTAILYQWRASCLSLVIDYQWQYTSDGRLARHW
jgi:hypothetical protein